jgi:hypothetical protein
MSFTELGTLDFPWPNRRFFQRKLSHAQKQLYKLTKAQLRRAKSRSVATIRRQYYLTDAVSDLRVAIGRNEDIFITAVMAILVLGFSYVATAANFLILFFKTAYDLADLSGINMGLLMVVAGTVIAVLFGWLAAFLLNLMSVAVMDGATRKVHRSVRSTVRTSLRQAGRVASAWLLFGCVIGLPLALGVAGSYYYMHAHAVSMDELLGDLPKAVIGALTWIVFAIMQYSLAPYVALFEPELPLSRTLRRSRQLVRRRGHLFLLFGYLIFGAALVAAYRLSSVAGSGQGLVFAMLTLIITFTAHGTLVMLYRKRKLARKH